MAVGCPRCFETGYLGRMVLGEVLTLDDDLREAINRGASEPEMRRLAASKGLVSMRAAGQALLQVGKTDRAELWRVLGSEVGGI